MRTRVLTGSLSSVIFLARGFARDSVDSVVQTRMREQGIPAVSIRIEKSGVAQEEQTHPVLS